MVNRELPKREYFLAKNHQVIPHNFHMYWSPKPFPRLYLGKASYSFKDRDDPREAPLKNWSFEFEETVPDFVKHMIINSSKTEKGNVNPRLETVDVEFVNYLDLYDYLAFRICPPHDDDDLGMKNFYQQDYLKIEDPEVKKLVLGIINEWSQPGYCLSKHCQYILKEIEEKEK